MGFGGCGCYLLFLFALDVLFVVIVMVAYDVCWMGFRCFVWLG